MGFVITNSKVNCYLLDITRWTTAPNDAPIIQAYPPPPPKLAKKSPKPKTKMFGQTVPTAIYPDRIHAKIALRLKPPL